MEIKSNSFVLYKDFEPTLLKLSQKDAGALFFMIYSYVNRGEIDSFLKRSPKVDVIFSMLRQQLDRDAEKYQKKCEKNSANGRLGGRPRSKSETQNNRSVFKKTYSDSDNKSDSDIESVSDSDNEIGRSFDPDDFFAAAVRRSYGEN